MEVIFEQHHTGVDHSTSAFSEFVQLNQGGNDELQTIKQKLEFDLQNLTNTLKEQAEHSLINVQHLVKSNKQYSEKINELQRENEKLRSDNSLISVKLQAAEHLLDKTNQEYYKSEAENKVLNEKLDKSKEKAKKLKESLMHTEAQMQELYRELQNAKQTIVTCDAEIKILTVDNQKATNELATTKLRAEREIQEITAKKVDQEQFMERLQQMIADLNSQLSQTEHHMSIQQQHFQEEMQLMHSRIQSFTEDSPKKRETIMSKQMISQHLNRIQRLKEKKSPEPQETSARVDKSTIAQEWMKLLDMASEQQTAPHLTLSQLHNTEHQHEAKSTSHTTNQPEYMKIMLTGKKILKASKPLPYGILGPSKDSIDHLVRKVIYHNDLELPSDFKRISQGLYIFGKKKIRIVTLNEGLLVVRVGGGFINFASFVAKFGASQDNLRQNKEYS